MNGVHRRGYQSERAERTDRQFGMKKVTASDLSEWLQQAMKATEEAGVPKTLQAVAATRE